MSRLFCTGNSDGGCELAAAAATGGCRWRCRADCTKLSERGDCALTGASGFGTGRAGGFGCACARADFAGSRIHRGIGPWADGPPSAEVELPIYASTAKASPAFGYASQHASPAKHPCPCQQGLQKIRTGRSMPRVATVSHPWQTSRLSWGYPRPSPSRRRQARRRHHRLNLQCRPSRRQKRRPRRSLHRS